MITAAAVDLARLPAIGLTELSASAALLTRVDRKYLLALHDLERVWDQLPRDALVLEIDGRRSFGYASTYLDTPDLASFHDAAYARRRRWKVRTRTYSATGGHFLEVKTRHGARTVKERIAWRATTRLDTVGRDFVEASLRSAGVALEAATLAAALTTTYERTTLLLPSSGARATLDLGLSWTTPDAATRSLGDRVVLETKSTMAPSELDRLLWQLGLRPQRLSKYAVGMAALQPALPHNRWHRLLATLAGDPT